MYAQYPTLRAMTRAGAALNIRDGFVTSWCAGGAGHVTADWIDARWFARDGVDGVPQPAINAAVDAAPSANVRRRRVDIAQRCFGIGAPVYAVSVVRRSRWYARRHSP